jgi:hypothetical protein
MAHPTICTTWQRSAIAVPCSGRHDRPHISAVSMCRCPINNSQLNNHVQNTAGADQRLKLFKADLLSEGSFSEAMQVWC